MIAGNRKLRAAKIARLETILAIVKHDIDDRLARRIAYIENVHRKDLSAIQKAKGIAVIYKDIGIPKEEAMNKVKHLHNFKDDLNLALMRAKTEKYNNNIRSEMIEITREFLTAFKDIALSANSRYKLLQPVTQLPEKVQEKAEEIKLPQGKAVLLTHSRLKENPDVNIG